MINDYFGFKLGQTQAFDEKGRRLVATKLSTEPLEIERIKSKDKEGYQAMVVNIKNKKLKIKNKKKEYLREIKIEDVSQFKIGDKLNIDQIFKTGDKVMVSGKTKGKGFAGVVKRWGFAGGPKTHGQSDRHRAPGSIGQRTTPGRVHKGKHMSGRMGGKTKTITGLSIYKIDQEKNELWIEGLVPGSKGEFIKISKQI